MGRLIAVLGLLFLLLLPVTAAISAEPGKMVIKQKCTVCHDLQTITEKEAYFSEWEKIVERMASYDSKLITPTDKLLALKYIKENLAEDGPGGRERHQHK